MRAPTRVQPEVHFRRTLDYNARLAPGFRRFFAIAAASCCVRCVQRGARRDSMIGRISSFAAALLGGLVGLGIHTVALAGATPSNDDCGSPITLQLGAPPFTTEGATTAGPAMCAVIGGDVWFKFKSTFTGNLRVSTCDDADFDPLIAVYSGCSCGSFNLLACNDESSSCPDHTSKLIVAVEAGKCYRIR